MKNNLKIFGIIVLTAVIGLFITGCLSTTDPLPTRYPALAEQTIIPNKDYVVVGTIVLRNVRHQTLIADLMDMAIAMGGHDIINVRFDWRQIADSHHVNTATAVVIQYTEETLMETASTTVTISDGVTTTTTATNRYVGLTGSGGGGTTTVFPGEDDGGSRRGFFGRR